jgi:hypothetical protein
VYRNCRGRPGAPRRRRKEMRWTRVAPLALAAALLVRPVSALAQSSEAKVSDAQSEAPLPVSLDRIRKALAAPPPRLQPPPPSLEPPTFRVAITEGFSVLEPLEEPPFDPTWGLPSVGQLMMGGIGKLGSAAAGYKKKRAKRRATREVQDALDAFCAERGCEAPPARPARPR